MSDIVSADPDKIYGSKVFNERFWDITVDKCENIDEDGLFVNIILENDKKMVEMNSIKLNCYATNKNITCDFLKRKYGDIPGTYPISDNNTVYASITTFNKDTDNFTIYYGGDLYISAIDRDDITYVTLLYNNYNDLEILADGDCDDLLDQIRNYN